MADKDIWWTAPAQADDGRTVMVTGHDGLDARRESGKFPDRVEVTWTYSGPDMPADSEAELMERADDAIREALKSDKGVILTGIYTGAGQRNWVFYVKNTRIFQGFLNRAWRELPLLPVTISAEKDPEWEEYREMRELTYIDPSDE